MQDEIWSWQNGTASSETLTAVAAGDDGTVLLAGYTEGSWGRQIAAEGDTEMVATKLQLTDSGATELWRWQGGWDTRVDGVAKAKITSAAMAPDGSVFLVGGGQEESSFDSVVFRLDSSGSLVWEWKGDGVMYDALHLTGMALVGDGSGDVYVVGSTLVGDGSGDIYAGGSASYAEESDGWFFVAYRVSAEGSDVWRWQGTNSTSWQLAGAASIDDGNAVVFVGEAITIALNHNTYSYPYAVKLDSNGNELWVWEDDPSYSSLPRCTDVAAANNESVVLACAFDGDRGRFGDSDFGAVMLNSSDGDEMWRWQGGTVEDDEAFGVAVTESGDIVLAGYTEGSWTMESLGGKDFAAVRLSSSDWAASVVSGWQGGSAVDAADSGDDEECTAIAMSVNDTVILAGGTGGSWSTTNAGGTDFAAVGVLASFSGTPDVASPTSPPAEDTAGGAVATFLASKTSVQLSFPLPALTVQRSLWLIATQLLPSPVLSEACNTNGAAVKAEVFCWRRRAV
eukprot:g5653.t1